MVEEKKVLKDIVDKFKAGSKTLEETNNDLAAAGAPYCFSAEKMKENPEGKWTDAEMEEGFIPNADGANDLLPDDIDMSFRPELADLEFPVVFKTKKGTFYVWYNENGRPGKWIKV